MLTVTREGKVTGDYWAGIRKVEQARVRLAVEQIEQKQAEQYVAAVKAIPKAQPAGKTDGRQKRKPAKKTKPTLYDEIGETIEKLYIDGWTMKQIAGQFFISTQTVSKILKKRDRRGA